VNRRLLLAAGALVAAAGFSSCSTFKSADVAARVNGDELTRTELDVITGSTSSGDEARGVIADWIRLAVLGGDLIGISSKDDLAGRRDQAVIDLSTPYLPEAEATYDKGLDGSPVLCLGAIPLDPGADTAIVLADLASGTSWAAAAATHSASPDFAQNGGLVLDQNGANCVDPTVFNPELIDAMKAAGAEVGKPVAIDVGGNPAVVQLRPFIDLTPDDRTLIVQPKVAADLSTRLAATTVYVSPRFGRWDAKSVSVVALGN
jgi:hypothetical protein